jgi:hypothetical protein
MANTDELKAQIEEAESLLKDLESQLDAAQSDDFPADAPDTGQDVGGQEAAVDAAGEAGGEASFNDQVEARMSPAEEVAAEETTPLVDAVVEGEAAPEEASMPDMDSLYEIVYSEAYDANSAKSAQRMRDMEEAMKNDPRILKMAKEEPEKFALFMYGRASKA